MLIILNIFHLIIDVYNTKTELGIIEVVMVIVLFIVLSLLQLGAFLLVTVWCMCLGSLKSWLSIMILNTRYRVAIMIASVLQS